MLESGEKRLAASGRERPIPTLTVQEGATSRDKMDFQRNTLITACDVTRVMRDGNHNDLPGIQRSLMT